MPRTSLMMRRAACPRKSWREVVIVGGHAVGRGDGAQRADEIVGARIAHHADRAHRQQHGEGLPDLVVEPPLSDLVEIDGVRLAQDGELLLGDLAGNADGKAGPRERDAG